MTLESSATLSTRRPCCLATVLKWAVIVAILSLIGRELLAHLPELRRQPIRINVPYLLGSLALLCMHYLLQAYGWHLITVSNRAAIPRAQGIRVWFYSLLGKYVPGKVLLWAGRVWPYKRAGHSIKRVTFCFTLEMALQLVAACVITLVALAYSPDSPLAEYREVAWGLLVILTVLIHPRILEALLNTALRWFRREPVTLEMTTAQAAALLLGYVGNGLVLGGAFCLFVSAMHPVNPDQFLYVSAALLVAGMAGVLSVFAPAGLGVREGVLMLVLCVIMPKPIVAIIVLAARVWITVGELLCVTIVFLHDKLTQRRDATRNPQRAAGFSLRDSSNTDINPPRAAGGHGARLAGSPRGPTPTNPRSTLILLSLLGFALVWISTSLYGVGLSPDSVNYIATARNLLAGNGYLTFDDTPFTHWAPLLPTMLAGLGAVGIEPQTGARLINAASFALIIFLCGQLFVRHVKSRALAILGAVSILLANPLFGHCALALTEPTFVLLSIWLFIVLVKFT